MNIGAISIERSDAYKSDKTRCMQPLALAMAYVPMQCLKNAYTLEKALVRGTLFPELDKPFTGTKGGNCDV